MNHVIFYFVKLNVISYSIYIIPIFKTKSTMLKILIDGDFVHHLKK